MKKRLFYLMFFIANITYSQTDDVIIGGNYFVNKIPAVTKDVHGKSTTAITFLDNASQKKEVKDGIADNKSLKVDYIDDLDFVHFKIISKDKKSKEDYSMPLKDFKRIMSNFYDRVEWRVGVYAIPFKLRFNDFDFESDVTLGANLSFKYRFNREREDGFSIEPIIIGIGLTKVNLDESNSIITDPGSTSALTINSGVLIHINSKINLGIFYGGDFLSDKDNKKYDWKYNGNGWLGLGINVSFSDGKKNEGNL
jgi:hypothetical protein